MIKFINNLDDKIIKKKSALAREFVLIILIVRKLKISI